MGPCELRGRPHRRGCRGLAGGSEVDRPLPTLDSRLFAPHHGPEWTTHSAVHRFLRYSQSRWWVYPMTKTRFLWEQSQTQVSEWGQPES